MKTSIRYGEFRCESSELDAMHELAGMFRWRSGDRLGGSPCFFLPKLLLAVVIYWCLLAASLLVWLFASFNRSWTITNALVYKITPPLVCARCCCAPRCSDRPPTNAMWRRSSVELWITPVAGAFALRDSLVWTASGATACVGEGSLSVQSSARLRFRCLSSTSLSWFSSLIALIAWNLDFDSKASNFDRFDIGQKIVSGRDKYDESKKPGAN
jgi:hypothetical protein